MLPACPLPAHFLSLEAFNQHINREENNYLLMNALLLIYVINNNIDNKVCYQSKFFQNLSNSYLYSFKYHMSNFSNLHVDL